MRAFPCLLGGLLLTGCGAAVEPPGPSPVGLPVPPAAQAAVVVRVVDGDTVILRGRGTGPLGAEPTRVRLLLIDTPEVHGDEVECFGPQAAERAAELLLPGAQVRVQADVDPRDRFDRTLVHVWTQDGRNVGESLLADGYATVLVVGPNERYLDRFRAVESAAEQAGSGLWSACPG